MGNLRFLPECLNCGSNMGEVEDLGLGMQGGSIDCHKCGEHHTYFVRKSVMTLKRFSVPIGYTGQAEKRFEPLTGKEDLTSTKIIEKQPFNFSSGEAMNLIEFVLMAPKHIEESIKHLFSGNFEKWFESIGEQEIAEFARLARECSSSAYRFTLSAPLGLSGYDADDIDKIKEKLLEVFLGFVATNDPLDRARRWWALHHFTVLDDKRIEITLAYGYILRIVESSTRKKLSQFIEDYARSAAKEKNFKLRTKLFKKPIWFTGKNIERLMPKLQALLQSELWEVGNL